MKSKYKVILQVTDRNMLADIIDAVESKAASIEIETVSNHVETVVRPQRVLAARQPRVSRRGRRTSKVNTAILSALSDHSASIADMKAALTQAGLSAGSLSTGIAALTKSGQIERVGEGTYSLKTQQAAE